MILKYVYIELPSIVRIKSESLCLDHIFSPDATMKSVSYDDLFKLLNKGYIDSVHAFVPNDSMVYCFDTINNEKLPVSGWIDLSDFDAVEPFS